MSTSQEYTISRKVSDTEEEIIQIPYGALANKPDLSVYQTKNDASLETNNKTVVGAINEVVTGVAGTLESFGMSLAPQENGKLNKKVYVYPDGYFSQGTSYDASKDLYLSIGDGLALETIDEANNIWNIKSGSAITSVDGLGGGAISGNVSTSGSLTVGGSLTVNGTTTTVDSTTLQVKDKLIEVAHGNTTALTTPAGLVAPKYDGTNSGALVFDSTGTAYVGDVKLDSTGNIDVAKSELQPLATRTGLVGGNLVQYDSTAQTLKDSGKKISDLATTSQVNAKYTKPSGGIPKTDLASDVQTSLGKADSALQAKDISGKLNKSGDTMTGSLTIQEGNAINVSQYNDAGGVSLMNNGGGTATQFGSSTRPARMFSSVQPEWYKNGASQGVLALKSDIPAAVTESTVSGWGFTKNKGTVTSVAVKMNGVSKGTVTSSGTIDLGTVLTDASQFATSAQGTKADNALSLDGGTIKKSKTIKMDASANSDGANLKWGTVNSKNPYIGYASDQVDGTFVVGSLLGTNYASGLAIGGGSGNLLWKGAKVATTSDIPTVNNGTLTIQKNGTTVATFSANQSGNATANITVPTFSLSGTTLYITL